MLLTLLCPARQGENATCLYIIISGRAPPGQGGPECPASRAGGGGDWQGRGSRGCVGPPLAATTTPPPSASATLSSSACPGYTTCLSIREIEFQCHIVNQRSLMQSSYCLALSCLPEHFCFLCNLKSFWESWRQFLGSPQTTLLFPFTLSCKCRCYTGGIAVMLMLRENL